MRYFGLEGSSLTFYREEIRDVDRGGSDPIQEPSTQSKSETKTRSRQMGYGPERRGSVHGHLVEKDLRRRLRTGDFSTVTNRRVRL